MRTKAFHPVIAGAILSMIAFTVWPGCISPPLPATRHAIMDRKKSDFKFDKARAITRGEIIEKMGKPDEDFQDLRIIAYRVNDVTRRNLLLVFFVIPADVTTSPGYQDIAFIEFDSEGLVQRSTIVDVYKRTNLHREAEIWSAQKKDRKS
jgi:hypothetical protein